ncbi:MAG: aldo/keto reductase [Verrucomicrobiota bacterium]|nr:aldo/keto reductase [Verrucomicrobiota bacterium]
MRPIQRDRLSKAQLQQEPARYEKMPYRRCGASGLKLPALALGAWETFGGYRGPEIARECIFRAFNLGINHFDLANNYGQPPGRAETTVGRVLRELPRDELIVSTKAGFPMWDGPHGQGSSRKHLLASIDQSLKRLEVDYVDIFYSHRFDADVPLEETLGALDQIVRSGKALYVALSNYPTEKLADAISLAQKMNVAPIIAHQSFYNLLYRDVEKTMLPLATEKGVGVIAFSPLAQGLLSTKYADGVPEESRAAKLWDDKQRALLTSEIREKTRKLNEIAKRRGQTLPQMALAWILRRKEITSVLFGASEVDQVEENVKALEKLDFTADELKQIDDAR